MGAAWLCATTYDSLDALRHRYGQASIDETVADGEKQRRAYGVQGVHLNPLGLFLCTSIPCIWSILSACPPS